MEATKVPVCKIEGAAEPYYGTPNEAIAAKLEPGDAIKFRRHGETRIDVGMVKYVWFYEGPMIALENGAAGLCPELGDEILEVLRPGVS